MSYLDQLRGVDDAVYQMERNGLLLDVGFCNTAAKQAEDDIAGSWAKCAGIIGRAEAETCLGLPPCLAEDGIVKGESGKEMIRLLHHDMGMKPSPYWGKGAVKPGEIKTDARAIGWLAREYPEHREFLTAVLAVRRGRSCHKYLAKLPGFVNPKTGRVHTVFGAVMDGDDRFGAVTGRLACKYPELQQIPKNKTKDAYRIRKAFTAAPGNVFLECDETALEVVILAHITKTLFGDTNLAESLAQDIHGVNALAIFRDFLKMPGLETCTPENIKEHPVGAPLREMIKAVWYGMMYGKGGFGFGSSLFDEDGVAIGEERATALVEGILTVRPGIRRYQEWVRAYIQQHRGISSLLGRRVDLSDLVPGKPWMESRAWRKALNFPMQAGGADIMGIALARAAADPRLKKMGFKLMLQIHDALAFEGPEQHAEEAGSIISGLMTEGYDFMSVPLQAPPSWGPNWNDQTTHKKN